MSTNSNLRVVRVGNLQIIFKNQSISRKRNVILTTSTQSISQSSDSIAVASDFAIATSDVPVHCPRTSRVQHGLSSRLEDQERHSLRNQQPS